MRFPFARKKRRWRPGPPAVRDFGRARKPRASRRGVFITAGAVLAVAIVAGGIVFVAPILADLPFLAVTSVSVRGNTCLAASEVRDLAGIDPGRSLLHLGRAEALGRLLQHPRIESAVVAIRPWSEVVILVSERHPLALLSDGGVREISADGRVLPAAEGRLPSDAPLLTGFAGAGDPRLAEALHLVQWLAVSEPALHESLSEVRPDSAGTLEAYLTAGHFWVRIPTPVERAEAGLRYLTTVVNDLAVHGIAGASLDLEYDGQIVVRPHPAWAAAADSAYAPPAEQTGEGQGNRENRRRA